MENDIKEPFIQYKDEEDQNDEIEREIAKKIREGFVAKVFGIVLYQVFVTSLVVCLGLFNSTFQQFLLDSYFSFYFSLITFIVLIVVSIKNPEIYKKVPTNYILLTALTLSFSFLLAEVTCQYTPSSVLFALILTMITVATLTIYSMKVDKDLTVVGGTLFVTLALLIFASIFSIFVFIPIVYLIIIVFCLVITSIYLIYDIQLLIGNRDNRRFQFSEDDYIIAAIFIYLDIIRIFEYILALVGKNKE